MDKENYIYAGICCYGFSGTNSHIILKSHSPQSAQQYPDNHLKSADNKLNPQDDIKLIISSYSEEHLQQLAQHYVALFEKSEFDHKITALLDEYVRPAVENDGGAIDYVGYKDGDVTVLMKGSCAGCPSSTATLKGGIETLLKQHIPEVNQVIAINPSI